MDLNVTQRDDHPGDGELTLVQQMLGTVPYILIDITPREDEDFDINIASGGGIPADLPSLVTLLDLALDSVKQAIAAGATTTTRED